MKKETAAVISIIFNLILIIFKIVAGVLMLSISVISEAIHSGIDLIASVVAFFSIRAASRPADEDHPFGHWKFENLSGAFEAVLILFAAGFIVYEAVKKIINPHEIGTIDTGIIVMLISTVVNLGVSILIFRVTKRTGSIALEADAWHHFTDVFTSAGVLAGLVLIKIFKIPILDPIAAIIVSLLILKASIDLIRKSVGDLVDESLPKKERETIIKAVKSFPEVQSYHKLRTRKYGDIREIILHVQIDGKTPLKKAHRLCYRIENAIKADFPKSQITIHIEPEKD